MQVGYANHFYRSAHKFEQICRHRLRRQNVGYSKFSQPQSHLSFCVLLQYLVERRRVVPSLVSWIKHSVDRFVIVSIFIPKLRLILILNSFLGSSDSLVFSELFHSLSPRPLAADRKSGSAGMPRPISYAVFCLKKNKNGILWHVLRSS